MDIEDAKTTTKDAPYTITDALEKAGWGRFNWWLLVLTGIIDSVYACQALMPTFLIPILRDVWALDRPWDSMIGIVFFVGTMFGNLFWSKFADIHGRKKAIIFASFVLAASTTFTGITNGLITLLICRFFTGCGTVTSVSYTIFIEFSPMMARAKSVLMLTVFWTIGGVLSVVLAWIIVPIYGETSGWRLYVYASSIPAWIAVLLSFWIPESPWYYTTIGENEKAEKTLNMVLKSNKKEPMTGHLIHEDEVVEFRGRFKDLFVPKYRRTSLVLGTNLINSMAAYYGIIFLSERLFSGYSLYLCELLTTISEIPGFLFGSFTMNKIGRKYMIIFTMFFATFYFLCIVLLWHYEYDDQYAWVIIVIAVLLTRSATSLHGISVKLYLSEYYPTAIRATAVGSGLFLCKFGAIGGTLISEDLDVLTASIVFTIVSAMGFATSLLIREDTTFKILTNDVDRNDAQSPSVSILSREDRASYVLFGTV